MTKLTDKQVKNMVRRVVVRGLKPSCVCTTYGVSERRVQQLVKLYRETGRCPVLVKNRRPKTFLSEADKRWIDEAWEWHRVCAPLLKNVLDFEHSGNHIAVNKIHAHLKETRRAIPDPKKQKKRKRCRYERGHSFSLAHTDWTEWNGKMVIAVQDDASRLILSGGEYENATGALSIECMRRAQETAAGLNASIREVNSDMGSQFYATKKKNAKKRGMARFEKYLASQGIKHIPSRRNNPQTNGKIERWVKEYKKHRARFNSFEEFTHWYNNRIHGSLKTEWAETPSQAVIRKLRPENLLGLFYKNVVK